MDLLLFSTSDTVLVDNGLLRLEVLQKDEARIRCRVLIAGELRSRRHINLPGVKVNLPSFTEKDRADATVGLVEGKISNQTFEEWNRETGGAKLPERVTPKGKTSSRPKARSKRKPK